MGDGVRRPQLDHEPTPRCPTCGHMLRVTVSRIVSSTRRSQIGEWIWSVRCPNGDCKRTMNVDPTELITREERDRPVYPR